MKPGTEQPTSSRADYSPPLRGLPGVFESIAGLSENIHQTLNTTTIALRPLPSSHANVVALAMQAAVTVRMNQMLFEQVAQQVTLAFEAQLKTVVRMVAFAAELHQIVNSPEFIAFARSLAERAALAATQAMRAARIAEAVAQSYPSIDKIDSRLAIEVSGSSSQTPVRRIHSSDNGQVSSDEHAGAEALVERRLVELEPLSAWQTRSVWFVVWCLPLVLIERSGYLQAWALQNPILAAALLDLWTQVMLEQRPTFHKYLGEPQQPSK